MQKHYPADEEIPLEGGNTSSGVVRIGDTVRKDQTPHSETVHRLLSHMEKNGFTSCPKFLGIDGNNREVLSFVNGQCGIFAYIWTSVECLKETASVLRRYHDSTVDFPCHSGDSWAFNYPDKSRHEVIGHNDYAPYNTIFRNELPISVIDFDLAGPAPRSRDLAYSAYWNVPLSFNDESMKKFAIADLNSCSPRLKTFCEAYGVQASVELLDMTSEVLSHMGSEESTRSMVGEIAARNLRDAGHFAHWKNELVAFEGQKGKLLENISQRAPSS